MVVVKMVAHCTTMGQTISKLLSHAVVYPLQWQNNQMSKSRNRMRFNVEKCKNTDIKVNIEYDGDAMSNNECLKQLSKLTSHAVYIFQMAMQCQTR
jgi:hypothetical protein